jgi:uncharacterized protein (TIGR03492 family)
MHPPRRILWVSNGHGEDHIAQSLIRYWQHIHPQDQHQALAMVGEGSAYAEINVPLLTPGFVAPSAGFAYLHPRLLWKDIEAGLGRHLYRQWQALHTLRHSSFDLRVAVGDIVPLLALTSSGHYKDNAPKAFVACALSDYYTAGKSSFDPLQVALLRRHSIHTYTRDGLTADNLCQRGVQAHALGNPMQLSPSMANHFPNDLLAAPHETAFHGLLLPGSHQDAEANAAHLLQQIAALPAALKHSAIPLPHWHLLLSPHLSAEQQGRIEAIMTAGCQTGGMEITFHRGTADHFATLLPCMHFAIGLAGTANEQCVAHGVPVISFPGAPAAQQYTAAFGEAQQRLLGAGLRFYPHITPELLAWQIQHLYRQFAYYRQVTQQIARERFGDPGAVERIVAHFQKFLSA